MIGDIKHFRFWCQKVLPLVYDNSLSYYEVLCKVSAKLNELINNVNDIPEYIDAKIEEAFDEEHITEILSQFIAKIQSAISANNEGTNVNSSKDYNVGQMLWLNDTLYRVIRPISAGATFIVDTNIEAVDFETLFNDFVDEVKHDITANDDGTSATATQSWTAGQWLWLNDDLYEVVSDITQGNAYVFTGANANVHQITVEDMMIKEATTRANADTTLTEAISDEVTARENADTNINNAITALTTDFNNTKYYVTPEDYGAIGDGVTDDTQAFYNAFHSGKPVKCFKGKTYKIGVLDLHDMERIFLDGNYAKFIGGTIHINVEPNSNTWIKQYAWSSYISNCYFIANDDEVALHVGCGIRLTNCAFDEYDTAIDITANYIDEVFLENVFTRNYSRGDTNTPRILHRGEGDLITFINTHCTGTVAHQPKYFFEIGYTNCGVAINCINCGIHFRSASTFNFISCLYNNSDVARITVGSYDSSITCHNCRFAGVHNYSDNVKYVDCEFIETWFDGGKNGLTIEKFAKMDNCKIGIHRGSTTLGFETYLNSDDCKNNTFNYPINYSDSIYTDSMRAIDSNNNVVPGVSVSGRYTYYVVPSMYPDRILRNANGYFSNGVSVNANAGQTIFFRYAGGLYNSYKHVYKVDPNGNIYKAVVPPSPTALTGIARQYMIDNGLMNGFSWEQVDSLPTLSTSNLSMTNSIVSALDDNLPTGTLYIDTANGNVIKQK